MIVQRGRPISFTKRSRMAVRVLDEEMRLVLARPVAGGGPGVAAGDDVSADRRCRDGPRAGTPLDPVREHDEPALPVRGRLDEIACTAEHAAAADREAVGFGARRAG